jgi:hypothetical protein
MGRYADGMNLYQILGSNPVNRLDPLGLCKCGPKINNVFIDALFRISTRMNSVSAADKGLIDGVMFLKRNGNNIDFVVSPPQDVGCPTGEKCEDTVQLAGACLHWSQVNNIMFGFVGEQVGANKEAAVFGADIHNRINKGFFQGEDNLQRGSYATGWALDSWLNDPDYPLTKDGMRDYLKNAIPWYKLYSDPLHQASGRGKYKECDECDYQAKTSDVTKDFSKMIWQGDGQTYEYEQ